MFNFLSTQSNEFGLGNLHGLRYAPAADRFYVIDDDTADINEGFLISAGTVGRKHGVIGFADWMISGQRFLGINIDTGQKASGQHHLGQRIEINQV